MICLFDEIDTRLDVVDVVALRRRHCSISISMCKLLQEFLSPEIEFDEMKFGVPCLAVRLYYHFNELTQENRSDTVMPTTHRTSWFDAMVQRAKYKVWNIEIDSIRTLCVFYSFRTQ